MTAARATRTATSPYVIGCVHGLAGSGGLVVLALSAVPDAIASSAADAGALLPLPLLLASVFGAGSTIGMVLVAGALSLLFAACGSTNTARRAIRYASGGRRNTVWRVYHCERRGRSAGNIAASAESNNQEH